MIKWNRPAEGEFIPYQQTYFDQILGKDLISALEADGENLAGLLQEQDAAFGDFRYEEGKWSVKEVMNHINDTERIMVYRALSFTRGEQQELPGFEQDDYVAVAGLEHRSLRELTDEFTAIRAASLTFFRSLTESDLSKGGKANGHYMSVNALCHVVAGHSIHHFNILKSRYAR